MCNFTSRKSINKMMRVVDPLLDEFRSREKNSDYGYDSIAPVSSMEATEYAVYMKVREMLLLKLYEEIGLAEDTVYDPEITCEDDILYHKYGESWSPVADDIFDMLYNDNGFIKSGPMFWTDEIDITGGFTATSELADYYFTQEGLEYFEIDNLREISYSTFKRKYPSATKVLKGMWKKRYAEEMTQALYKDMQAVFEECCYEEFAFSYNISVNVAIVPFLKGLRNNPKLRRDPISKFAIKLIRHLRYMSPYSDALGNIMHGFTKNLFYTSQMLGSGGGYYGSEIFPICLPITAQISMKCIDYVLAYLDSKYEFLPHDVRQLWRNVKREAANS